MNKKKKELLNAFNELSDETQDSILSHVRFAVLAEKAALKKVKQEHPEYELNLEPAVNLQAVNQV